jgi:lysophospholipase
VDPMRELLSRINIDGFDAGKYIDDNRDNTTNLPNIGIAFSGGGYRAMLNGAGALAAFDNRTPNATNGASQLGGLLQASTYIAGLSGGGWLVGSIYMNNFTSVQNIIDHNEPGDVWQLGNSILKGALNCEETRCAKLMLDRSGDGRLADTEHCRLLQ